MIKSFLVSDIFSINRFDFVVKENNIKCKSNNYERDNGVVPFFYLLFYILFKISDVMVITFSRPANRIFNWIVISFFF